MKQPHILCESKDISPYVILPGDPGRVLRIGEQMDSYEEVAYNREYRVIRGMYKDVPITVVSTGIGGPSAAIAMEELIACGGKYFIRVGSAGAVNSRIKLGELVICSGAVREDGATKSYVIPEYPAVADVKLTSLMIDTCEELGYTYHYGIVRSHDTLYTAHGEELREYWNRRNIISSDMETSTILTLAQLKGVKAGSILNTVAEYKSNIKDSIGDYADKKLTPMEGEKRGILLALETMVKVHNANSY